jgi:hypothetical protein
MKEFIDPPKRLGSKPAVASLISKDLSLDSNS